MTSGVDNVIVVGVDGSPSSTSAALWAAAQAGRRGAALRLIQAFDVSVNFAGPGMTIPPDFYQDVRHSAKKLLDTTRQAVTDAFPGIDVSAELLRGQPFPIIRAASQHAILTVVGSPGDSEIAESILGSVAQKVAAHAGSPVVVVRPHPTTGLVPGDGPVLVGLDGSPDSEGALSFALEEASMRGSDLVAVHSWKSAPRGGLPGPYPPGSNRSRYEAEQRLLAEQLSGWSEKYPDVRVHSLVLSGQPAATILRQFEDSAEWGRPSLIVVGSRGHGGFAGLLLGSTSHALIAHAPCPVGIVRSALRA